MCTQHRLDLLKEIKTCLAQNEPIICISTQLIEAGVDVDFEYVFRSYAGLDSLVQANGRCNREDFVHVWTHDNFQFRIS